MVARFTACNQRRLRQVLVAGAAEEIESDVAEHLETCENCRRELELMAGGADWWSDVRSFLSSADPVVATTDSAREDTTRRADAPESTHESQVFSGWRKQLGFLSPTEVAGSLGRLGPYEITNVIGRGGMGIVLKAFDPSLNRHVAIKVLAAEWAHNATARRRFAREAQAAAAVVHDHVVPIHAVDANGDIPFLVMAHIPGRSLQQRLDRTGPLEIKEILRIGMQAAYGLAAAHAQGLVHRDIKPANILLENSVERVRLTDFGLARAVDDVSQTQSGILAGTPQYMSPEQAAGEAVDHRADLFSLGSVLYAMCTGRSPFRAETTVAVIRRICDGHARPVREINPDVPEWLTEIIEKLHAKRPEDRFQTAGEVADLLERHLAHLQQPTVARQPARVHLKSVVAGSSSRRNRIRLLAAGGITIGLLAYVAVGYRTFFPLAEDTKRAGASQSNESPAVNGAGSGAPLAGAGGSAVGGPLFTEAPTAGTMLEEIENRPLDIEFDQLRHDLEGLERSLYPVAPPAAVGQRSGVGLEMERRLKFLEEEMRKTPVLERTQR